MSLFSRILMPWITPPSVDPDDNVINHPYATAMRPDQLILAHYSEDIVKNFDQWEFTGRMDFTNEHGKQPTVADRLKHRNGPPTEGGIRMEYNTTMRGSNGKLSFEATQSSNARENRQKASHPGLYYVAVNVWDGKAEDAWNRSKNNFLEMDGASSYDFMKKLVEFIETEKKAREVAAEAKRRMEENEKKWNRAENLTGLMRNADGALVPIPQEKKNAKRQA